MATADQIVARWRTDVRLAFIDGYKRTLEDLERCADLPVDTGRLRRGIEITVGQLVGNRMQATYKSTAESDRGFDYPGYLNVAPRIAPTKAKYLHFEVNGQWVRSAGFDNRHFRWWDNCWRDGGLWFDNIRAAFAR